MIRFAMLLVVAASGLIYINSLHSPFVFDDEPYIEYNEDIRQLWPPAWALPTERSNAVINSRPLTGLTIALNYAVGGLEVRGYHIVNIALHMACVLALYGVVRLSFAHIGSLESRAGVLALCIALLWGVHPLNSEVVNSIAQRSVSLVALCYLATLYCFLRGVAGQWRYWRIGILVCCSLGMLAKESMVSAPLAVLLFDRLLVCGSYREALTTRYKLYVGLACSWLLLIRGLLMTPYGADIEFAQEIGVWGYLLNQGRMITTYLGLVLWPDRLALDYGYPRPLVLADVWLECSLVLALVLLTGLAVYRGWRLGVLGAVVFMVLAPSSSVVPFVTEVGAERRMYIPLMAIATGAVLGGDWLWRRFSLTRWLGWGLIGGLAILLGWRTVVRNEDYTSEVSIWRSSVVLVPDSPRAHYNLANELAAVGDGAGASLHYRESLALDPNYIDAHNNWGLLLAEIGDTTAAVEHYRRAIEIDPDFMQAHFNLATVLNNSGQPQQAVFHYRRVIEMVPDMFEAHCDMGMALEAMGQKAEATRAYERALALESGMYRADYRLGLMAASRGEWAEAVSRLRRVVASVPDRAEVHFHLGRALVRADSSAMGIVHYRRAVELAPGLAEAHYNLGTVLLKRGQSAEALPHMRRVVALHPELAEGYNNLGIALQGMGRPAEAAEEFRRALRLRPEYAAAALARAGEQK